LLPVVFLYALSFFPLTASLPLCFSFFFTDTAPTEIYTLSLHDALPISCGRSVRPGHCRHRRCLCPNLSHRRASGLRLSRWPGHPDRKSTRLNSSHVKISYAVFCLKKKKKKQTRQTTKISTGKTNIHTVQ